MSDFDSKSSCSFSSTRGAFDSDEESSYTEDLSEVSPLASDTEEERILNEESMKSMPSKLEKITSYSDHRLFFDHLYLSLPFILFSLLTESPELEKTGNEDQIACSDEELQFKDLSTSGEVIGEEEMKMHDGVQNSDSG